ncbi:unnamed protein product [Closterium sp. NIES-53]
MFQHIKDLVELDDSRPNAWKLLHGVIQPNMLPMVIVVEKELAALSIQPKEDMKPVLDKIKDTYARMAAVRSKVSQMQRHTGSGAANKTSQEYGAAGGRNVLLVEGLSANLLSVRRLQKSKAKVTFSLTSCRAKLGESLVWDLEEKSSCIKDLWQLPIIPWNGRPPATAAAAATAKATSGGEETAPTDGALDAVKKVQQSQQSQGEVYPLKTKGEVAAAVLKEWMPRAQRESRHKVKVIRTDNGEEFIGADFEAVLKKKGIQHQLTMPYNPQQNSVAERFNWTLQEGARTLLGRAGLPNPFWVTSLRQVALVKNRVLATVGDKQWQQQPQQQQLQQPQQQQLQQPQQQQLQQPQQEQQRAPPCDPCPSDRPRRDVRPPIRLNYNRGGTRNVEHAGSVATQPDAEKWKQSVNKDYEYPLENETWELCELPPGKKAISSKLIFRHKYGPDGGLTCYKSRLVAKGFQQTKGKDFDETFAPVRKGTTLRVMLGTTGNCGWRIKQMDITTAFLNGIILEELYMLQPEGLDDGRDRVCRQKKAIYGLKQAPCAWYHKLEETLLAGGLKKSECDHSLFLLQEKEQLLMLLVYVDGNMLFLESSTKIGRMEEMQFKCSKMGDVKYYLGMHVERDLDKGVLRLHQRKYYEGLAEKYGLQDGRKPATKGSDLRGSQWSPVLMRRWWVRETASCFKKMEMLSIKVFKTTLDGRVLWDLVGGKDMHWSMWLIPVLPVM